uniref:Cystatin domain-containing protein n=1 Tax=Strongyloides papillosus TaxID=174720 RepID=A0A0N5C5J2_STREA
MKYLISFITLAIANFFVLTDTKFSYDPFADLANLARSKWEPISKTGRSLIAAIWAIDNYNNDNKVKYKLNKLIIVEKAVQPTLKLRIFFTACTKAGKKRKGRKGKKTCDYFRATFEKFPTTISPVIWVRKLSRKDERPSKPSKKNYNKTSKTYKKTRNWK